MRKNKYLIIISSLSLLCFLIITIILLVNYELRRKIFNYPTGIINVYFQTKIYNAVNDKNFETVSNYLDKYINISQKISKGKNKMMVSIFKQIKYASDKALTQEDFNHLEKIYLKINEIDDKIYLNNVWIARSLLDNDIYLAEKYLMKAVNLSPSSEEAYRIILKLYMENQSNNLDKDLIQKYCLNYFNNMSGGINNQIFANFFDGNMKDFGIYINDEVKNIYKQKIKKLNAYQTYEFNFDEKKNLNIINLIGTFAKGSIIEIKDFMLNNNIILQKEVKEIYLTSKKSYIIENDDVRFIILNIDENNNLIKWKFKNFLNIETLSFKMKVERLPITNKNFCQNLDEN